MDIKMGRDRLLTLYEAAEYLGYAHPESFRRALRRMNLQHVRPIRDRTRFGWPTMYKESDLRRQLREMPRLGRPREGKPAESRR